jgi:hypothetical protein
MEGGWDRTHNRARMLGERNFIMLGLFRVPNVTHKKIERQ